MGRTGKKNGGHSRGTIDPYAAGMIKDRPFITSRTRLEAKVIAVLSSFREGRGLQLILPKTRCFARGRVSGITPGREISTAQQESLWIDTKDASRAQSCKCGDFPESGNIPRTRWPASRSIDPFQSSRSTPLAFWRGFLIFANPSIRPSLRKSFGDTPRVFFQNPRPRPSTPHSSISARSFV